MTIAGADGPSLEGAVGEVEALGAEVKVGTIFNGKVVSVKDFGAFIELAPGTDGMCHISEHAEGYVKSVSDVVKVGDEISVKVINVDDQGRIKLSRKAVLAEQGSKENSQPQRQVENPVGGAGGHQPRHHDSNADEIAHHAADLAQLGELQAQAALEQDDGHRQGDERQQQVLPEELLGHHHLQHRVMQEIRDPVMFQ